MLCRLVGVPTERKRQALAAFQSKHSGVMMLGKQMADGILVGPSKSMDTTLTAVGSETQTHEIYAPVQTLVGRSESRDPEEETKLVVKTDLGYRLDLKNRLLRSKTLKPKFSSMSKNVLEEWRIFMFETSRGQSASHLLLLLVFFLGKCRLSPYRLPMECHMAFSFWIRFAKVECKLLYFPET